MPVPADSPTNESAAPATPSTVREAYKQATEPSSTPIPEASEAPEKTEATPETQEAPEQDQDDKGNLEQVDINSLPPEIQGKWKELYAGYTRARQKDRAEMRTAIEKAQADARAELEQLHSHQSQPQQNAPTQQQVVDSVQDPELAARIARMTPIEFYQFMTEQVQSLFAKQQQSDLASKQESFESKAMSDFEGLDPRLNPDVADSYDEDMREWVGTRLDKLYEEHRSKTGSYEGFDYVTHAKDLIQEYDQKEEQKFRRRIERQSNQERYKARELNKFTPKTSGGNSVPSGKLTPREAARLALQKLS